MKSNDRSNLPPKAYKRLANRVTVFCERHAIPTERFAELAGVPNMTLLKILNGSGTVTVNEWNRIMGMCNKTIPGGVKLGKEPLTGMMQHEKERLAAHWNRQVSTAKTVSPVEILEAVEEVEPVEEAFDGTEPEGLTESARQDVDDVVFLRDLRAWMDQYMVTAENVSRHIGRHSNYLTAAMTCGREIDSEARERLLDLMTATGLPPRELMAQAPHKSHPHIPETERMRRFWSLRAAYDEAEAEAERVRQQAEQEAQAQQQTAEEEPMSNQTTVTVQLPESLIARLEKDAESEFRSPAQQAAWIISKYFAQTPATTINGKGNWR